MFGIVPENFCENLLFLLGTENFHRCRFMFLATVKTIINEPELQNNQAGSGHTQKIIRQVDSEVTEPDERNYCVPLM